MMRSGTSRTFATARTSVLNRSASGHRSDAESPYFVKYPVSYSERLLVPQTKKPSVWATA